MIVLFLLYRDEQTYCETANGAGKHVKHVKLENMQQNHKKTTSIQPNR